MDKLLLARIRDWVFLHREELLSDLKRIVDIESVSEPGSDVKPFGPGCRRVLDEMLAIGRERGYKTENFEYYVGCLSKEHEGPSIGFWGHLDVVPAGSNWKHKPYDMTIENDFIVGRGVGDNKGPTMAVYYAFRCLDELGVGLRHGLKLFLGCDEEKGMSDMAYYTARYPEPDFNVIADTAFPVCYGEKGILSARLVSRRAASPALRELRGGLVPNMVPDHAEALLSDFEGLSALLSDPEGRVKCEKEGDALRVTAFGVSKHAAMPYEGVNAIGLLTNALSRPGVLPPADAALLQMLNRVNADCDGTGLSIASSDELSGPLTCVGSVLSLEEGKPVLRVNVRYPISADVGELIGRAAEVCSAAGCDFIVESDSKPSYFPKEHPAVGALTRVYNELAADDKEPYVMSGGTYARKLKKAVCFGIEGLPEPEGLPAYGGAHEPDEGFYIPSLLKAVEILAAAILEIDGMEL